MCRNSWDKITRKNGLTGRPDPERRLSEEKEREFLGDMRDEETIPVDIEMLERGSDWVNTSCLSCDQCVFV